MNDLFRSRRNCAISISRPAKNISKSFPSSAKKSAMGACSPKPTAASIDPSGPRPSAGPGPGGLRPARRGAQHRRFGQAPKGAGPADPIRSGAGHGHVVAGLGRSRGPVRRGHAAFADRSDPAGRSRQGADYRPDQVIGADIIGRSGGRVLLVDLLPSQGTTATIARVRARARAAG